MNTNKDDKRSPSEILGYYFVIFQDTFTGFVKCWIDGSEDYKYMSEKDFIGLFEKVNSPFELVYQARNCIETSSIYIWDVSNYRISRLTNLPQQPSLVSEINKMNPFFGK